MNKWIESTQEFIWLALLIFIGGPVMGAYMEFLMGPLAGWISFTIIEIMAIGLLISIVQSIREMK